MVSTKYKIPIMAYSIEIYFDTEFEKKLLNLWDKLNEHSIPSIMHRIGSRPHLALSILDSIEERKIPKILQYLSTNVKQFGIEFPAISMTPGENQAVFLAPTFNAQLFKIQKSLYDYLLKSGDAPKKIFMSRTNGFHTVQSQRSYH